MSRNNRKGRRIFQIVFDDMNIFLSDETYVSMYVEVVYRLLMKRNPVTYGDAVCDACGLPDGYFKNNKIDLPEYHYRSLTKAFPLVVDAINERLPGSVVNNGKHKGKAYTYVGEIDDPLAEDRKHYRQQTIEDYVRFCKGAIGLLPAGWFASFFEETNLLLETKREAENGNVVVGGAHDKKLRNIRLLPRLYNAITDHAVIKFNYKPFDKESIEVILHPQYLKEYNDRWFVLGQIADETLEVKSYPIDRITSEIIEVNDIQYEPAPLGLYKEYFKDIVGVIHTKNRKAYDIVIRTHSAYHHGLVTTKPFHHSQEERLPYGVHDDGESGEITMHVEPTIEIMGKIISLGENLEVVSPIGVRQQVADIVAKLSARYSPHE